MENPSNALGLQRSVGTALSQLRRKGYRGLDFPGTLEERFEAETRKARSYRLWLEGLTAILVLNACLVLDFAVVRDLAWTSIVRNTLVVTPLALVVNFIMRLNPVRWLREGSVAVSMVAICYINLMVQGNATSANILFGTICLLITALFAGVVMRLRFPYSVYSVTMMSIGGLFYMARSRTLHLSEEVVCASLIVIGTFIILVASYSLEREERVSYLLCLQSDLQTEELARINSELKQISSLDTLTGLPNRRSLDERFDLLWAQCAETGTPLSAVVIDIDHFKVINDVYGHMYGDEALKRIASLLPQALRGPGDMAARFGGEEFVLLLPHAEQEAAMTVAERVRNLVETVGTPMANHPCGETMMWATVSCGVSVCIPCEGITRGDLIEAADQALYASKRGGRNRVTYMETIIPEVKPVQELLVMPQPRSPRGPERRERESGIRRLALVTGVSSEGNMGATAQAG